MDGEAKMQPCQNPTPGIVTYDSKKLGRFSQMWCFSLRREGFVPPGRHPSPWDLTGERSPQNIWLQRPMRLMLRRNRAIGKEMQLLGGLHTYSVPHDPVQK